MAEPPTKGVLFVPDEIVIHITREGEEKYTLEYTERFHYLPQPIIKFAASLVEEIMKELLAEKNLMPVEFKKLEDGIAATWTGDYRVCSYAIGELMQFSRKNLEEPQKLMDKIMGAVNDLKEHIDFFYTFNDEAVARINLIFKKLFDAAEAEKKKETG